MASPPRVFIRFFRWYCHSRLADHIEGDLIEEYAERVKREGKTKADLKFMIDVILLFRPGIVRPFYDQKNINTSGMYKSYFKVGWRNVGQAKLLSFIKILGLSVGLTVCMLIFLFTKDEVSYDQFHVRKDQIYRVTQNWQFGSDAPRLSGATNAIMGEAFAAEIPEVTAFVNPVKHLRSE